MKKLMGMFLISAIAVAPAFSQGLFDQTADWSLDDGTKVDGSVSFADDVYTVTGNGADIWGNADEGFYAYTELSGSWTLQAKLEWVDDGGGNEWAKAGVMIRTDADDPASVNVAALQRGLQDQVQNQVRPFTGDATDGDSTLNPNDGSQLASTEIYVKVGLWAPDNTLWTEYSLDGSTWFHGFTTVIDDLPETLAWGLAVTNHENNDLVAEVNFSEVALTELTEKPDYLIQEEEIGIFTAHADLGFFGGLAGDASFADGTYTVTGSGADIWGGDDDFHFVWKEMSGAFEATAEELFITIPAGTNEWNKAGLMVRDSLSHASANAFAMVRQDFQTQQQRRVVAGADTSDTGIALVAGDPVSFRVRKVGNVVEMYYIDTEGNEVLEGSTVLQMSDPVYFGIAITAHDRTQLATIEVSGLEVTEFPFQVLREIPVATYAPGQSIPVSITADVREGETVASLTVTETVPIEGSVSDISDGGVLEDGVITWNLSDISGDTTVSYSFTAPDDPTIVSVNWGDGLSTGDGLELPVAGTNQLSSLTFDFSEPFSYPAGGEANENSGTTLNAKAGGRGWPAGSAWSVPDGESVILSEEIVEAGIVRSQPQELNPGNFSVQLSGEVGGGAARSFPAVSSGEIWFSYVFFEEGPAADHWSGLTLYNQSGEEVSFVGKPFNAEFAGIAGLTDGDVLTEFDYTQPNHFLVRYQLNGADSQVSLWLNPDESDRWDTYDATGTDNISDIAEIRLRRGAGSGSAYYDSMWISSTPALPPTGAGRVDLRLNDPDRPEELPAWDVISMDQFDDAIMGEWGFGHDVGDDYYLIVTGYIYYDGDGNQHVADGLPFDRISGLNGHMIGPFNYEFDNEGLKNSMKFENNDQQRGPFTFDVVPAGNYKELRSIMTVANGDGQLLATLHYADGSTGEGVINSDDWFNDPPGLDFPDNNLFINGMDRLNNVPVFEDANNPAVFENILRIDPERVLESITLELDIELSSPAYNLFDIIAIPADDPSTAVAEWHLF